jgi:hypothetical protein
VPGEREGKTKEGEQIVTHINDVLTTFVDDPTRRQHFVALAMAVLPEAVLTNLDELLRKPDSYRDGLLVLLAAPLVRGATMDIRTRQAGWRGATEDVGRRVLPNLHIRGVKGAFEVIGKNTRELIRGNKPAWDDLLVWASTEAELPEIEAALNYLAGGIAATARTVASRPKLRLAALTFGRVMAVLSAMLARPSGGAHEQYILASLLEAALTDAAGTRVTTKSMNASDRSSRTAGDIEVTSRGRLQEGIEVSANAWQEKLGQAEDLLREHGLPRTHIIAAVSDVPYDELVSATERDVTVLDVRATIPVLVAFLDRRGRESALLKLYELLDEQLASPELVNAYVQELQDAELAE